MVANHVPKVNRWAHYHTILTLHQQQPSHHKSKNKITNSVGNVRRPPTIQKLQLAPHPCHTPSRHPSYSNHSLQSSSTLPAPADLSPLKHDVSNTQTNTILHTNHNPYKPYRQHFEQIQTCSRPPSNIPCLPAPPTPTKSSHKSNKQQTTSTKTIPNKQTQT